MTLPAELAPWQRTLLTDPQTSGGLLVACATDSVDTVLGLFRSQGFARADVIGSVVAGAAQVSVG